MDASFPQYEPGHLDRVEPSSDSSRSEAPNIVLAGAAFRGLGVPACIRQGREAAVARRSSVPAPDDARSLVPCRASLGAGLLLAASLPPWGWWPLAFVGLVMLDRLIADQPAWSRFRRGWLVAAALLFPTLSWLITFTAPGYVIAAAYYSADVRARVHGVPAERAGPVDRVARRVDAGRGVAGPVAVRRRPGLAAWPWARSTGRSSHVVRVGGTLLLDLVVVAVGVAIAAAIARKWRLRRRRRRGRRRRRRAGRSSRRRGHDIGSLRVALVQGGGPQGTRFFEADASIVFDRHVEATERWSSSRSTWCCGPRTS